MKLPLVELREVSKSFAGTTRGTVQRVLTGINLCILESEFVSLLGPSGCGKSTVLRIAAELSEPTSGHLVTDSSQPDAHSKQSKHLLQSTTSKQSTACVFQEPTLLPWARVHENVYLPLRLAGVSRTDAKPLVEEAIERVGLSDSSRKYPRQLSGGMKMRVSIARALVTRPRLLLLDEPFAALDEMTRLKLNDDLLALRDEFGFGVLFITHSIYESVYLSDRLLIMGSSPGRIINEMPIDLPQPRNEATRALPRYAELCQQASDSLHNDQNFTTAEGKV